MNDMTVGKIEQSTEECDKLENTSSMPRGLYIRANPEKYIDALEARIKELEEKSETYARRVDAELETLNEIIERITTQIKDIRYSAWEDRNGYDI